MLSGQNSGALRVDLDFGLILIHVGMFLKPLGVHFRLWRVLFGPLGPPFWPKGPSWGKSVKTATAIEQHQFGWHPSQIACCSNILMRLARFLWLRRFQGCIWPLGVFRGNLHMHLATVASKTKQGRRTTPSALTNGYRPN